MRGSRRFHSLHHSSNAYYSTLGRGPELHLALFDINGYYNFISTAMIALFIIGLVIIFVYEYEALRRSKPSRGP